MSMFDVDEALIKKLAALLKETGLTEIEFESGDKRIRVNAQTAAQAATMIAATLPAASSAPVSGTTPNAARGEITGAVTSPMVGTAYLSPEPGSAPFIKIGDRIAKGQTVLIIEAMKVMNPIAALEAGIVAEILITDGQPVEFGEPLIIVR